MAVSDPWGVVALVCSCISLFILVPTQALLFFAIRRDYKRRNPNSPPSLRAALKALCAEVAARV